MLIELRYGNGKTNYCTNYFLTIIPVFILIVFSGCNILSDKCGLFGATSTYSTEFVLDKKFTSLQVTVGDTLIFRPETHAHVNFYYTGSSSCDGKDYKDAPNFEMEVEYDSIAAANEFYDSDSEPLWRGTELKIRIIGKQAGTTNLNLDAEWSQESNTRYIKHEESFDIELNVIAKS